MKNRNLVKWASWPPTTVKSLTLRFVGVTGWPWADLIDLVSNLWFPVYCHPSYIMTIQVTVSCKVHLFVNIADMISAYDFCPNAERSERACRNRLEYTLRLLFRQPLWQALCSSDFARNIVFQNRTVCYHALAKVSTRARGCTRSARIEFCLCLFWW